MTKLKTHLVTTLEIKIVTTQVATKLKTKMKEKKTNFDRYPKLEIVTKLKNSSSDNSNSEETLNGLLVRTTRHLDN